MLYQAVKGISDLITQNGIVNVDFADVKTVMSNMGRALMGTGIAKGQNRARMAAEMAVASPLLDDISVDGATGVLINIVGGPDLKMKEIQEAASLIQEQAHEDANIIFGASIDETLGENVKVTVIATGFDTAEREIPVHHEAAQRMTMPSPHTMQSPSQRPSYSQQSASYTQGPSSARTSQPNVEHVPAMSTRRVQHAHEARTAAPHSQQQPPPSRAPVSRERPSSDSFPNFDNEWDVPAFQRKQR